MMKNITRRLKQFAHPIVIIPILTVFSLKARENYPFSHYPMYSKNGSGTYYVYLQDRDGNPIATSKNFRISTSQVKKLYRSSLSNKSEAEAARQVLEKVRKLKRGSADLAESEPTRLIKVDLKRDGDQFKRSETTLYPVAQ